MTRPQAFNTTISVSNTIARCRRGAWLLCIRWWNSCPRSSADKPLGYSKAGRAVVVEVLAIEFIENWVKHNSLLVDGDN
jgi:hypothetical protein